MDKTKKPEPSLNKTFVTKHAMERLKERFNIDTRGKIQSAIISAAKEGARVYDNQYFIRGSGIGFILVLETETPSEKHFVVITATQHFPLWVQIKKRWKRKFIHTGETILPPHGYSSYRIDESTKAL